MRIIDYGHEFHVFWEFDHWHKRNLESIKALPETERKYTVIPKDNKKYWWVSGSQRETILQFKYTHKADIIVPEELRPEMIGEVDPLPICHSDGCPTVSGAFLKKLASIIDQSKQPILLFTFDTN